MIGAELPGSVRVTPIYDRSQTIVNSVADVQATLLFAFVLVVGVIFIFLGRATDTLIPAVALPLVPIAHIHGHARSWIQPGQSFANGADAGHRISGGRRHRVSGKHGAPDGKRHEAAGGLARKRARNQFHDSFDDDFARGGIFSARVHVRPGGPHLPRVCDHHRCFHYCVWTCFADADAADVREAAKTEGPRREAELGGEDRGARRKSRSAGVRQIAVVVSAASLDFRADLGRLHGGDDFAFHGRSESLFADWRQQLRVGRDDREGRLVAGTNACAAESGGD